MNNPKLLAAVIAKNEWPLLGLAIVHVLHSGADTVLVIDHDSNDETQLRIGQLQARFPGRIYLALNHDSMFRQAASIHLALSNFGIKEFDWVYVFDADEFMLFEDGHNFKTMIQEIAPDVAALRYEVENWIVPKDFDFRDLNQYQRISHQAIVNKTFNEKSENSIKSGESNFFDYPFPSKIIVRSENALLLAAGCHGLVTAPQKGQRETLLMTARVAHIPFISPDKLVRRIDTAGRERNAGFARSHGWQNEMISEVHSEGSLNAFWERHSISEIDNLNQFGKVRAEKSQTLSTALLAAEQNMDLAFESEKEHQKVLFELGEAEISAVNALLLQRDNLLNERDILLNERNNLVGSWSWRLNATIRKLSRFFK